MRELSQIELGSVSGAGGSCSCDCDSDKKRKNNNGYGNGAESGPPPGHSGEHNPQLTRWNRGPRGPR